MKAESREFDIAVVGAGHAGCEAALAAARLGMRTVLITHRASTIGLMPCNPAIGGIAKSHLVCELDALGGEMGINADYTGIQFRVLNTRKGPAVRANRVQSDKRRYVERMKAVLERQKDLTILEASAEDLAIKSDRLRGIDTDRGGVLAVKAAVLTPGTFLGGALHMGGRRWEGGRMDEPAAMALWRALRRYGVQTARLKTGTPPRLLRDSLDFNRMIEQPGTEPAPFFSWQARRQRTLFHVEQTNALRPWEPGADQISCYLTHTTPRTHEIVADNLGRSSLYGGAIQGTGVRYCPSIEDKIVKFAGKDSHHVFVEPEGRDTDWIYPNGLSNSLPEEIQLAMVHSVPGFERAAVARYGYAIEYEYCLPTQLLPTLEMKTIEGLFLAGQINGTTGYEEAAAQGFWAGANAARRVRGRPPLVMGRGDGYLGVLIDDLTLKGTDEPYRMFTSRAEHRLLLRQDNARFRMASFAEELGLANQVFLRETRQFACEIDEEIARLGRERQAGKTLAEILGRPESDYATLPGRRNGLPEEVAEQVEIQVKYRGYIEREAACIRKSRSMENSKIPSEFDYMGQTALCYEAREKLSRLRPQTLGQASRVPGVSPADIAALSVLTQAKGRKL
jgi:tRNA uridine 5-carboxymethylaminomethyl modification enzyme